MAHGVRRAARDPHRAGAPPRDRRVDRAGCRRHARRRRRRVARPRRTLCTHSRCRDSGRWVAARLRSTAPSPRPGAAGDRRLANAVLVECAAGRAVGPEPGHARQRSLPRRGAGAPHHRRGPGGRGRGAPLPGRARGAARPGRRRPAHARLGPAHARGARAHAPAARDRGVRRARRAATTATPSRPRLGCGRPSSSSGPGASASKPRRRRRCSAARCSCRAATPRRTRSGTRARRWPAPTSRRPSRGEVCERRRLARRGDDDVALRLARVKQSISLPTPTRSSTTPTPVSSSPRCCGQWATRLPPQPRRNGPPTSTRPRAPPCSRSGLHRERRLPRGRHRRRHRKRVPRRVTREPRHREQSPHRPGDVGGRP